MKLTPKQREIVTDCLWEHKDSESPRDPGMSAALAYLADCTDASYRERVEAVQDVRRALEWA